MSDHRTAPDAWIFDTDGVLTRTAVVHEAAWAETFDRLLSARGDRRRFTHEDYLAHVDGRPRQDGVLGFLSSRGVELPLGTPEDPPGDDTAWAVGNRKNQAFTAVLARDGVEAYPASVALVRRLRGLGVRVAAVSASRNQALVLSAAGIADLFDVRVDGLLSDELGLAGKPAPDLFVEGARRCGVAPPRSVVVEDARSGVQAGRAGGFGLVLGVDRGGQRGELLAAGADLVVEDLSAVKVADDRTVRVPGQPDGEEAS